MNDTKNEQDKARRLIARYAYIRELASVQAEQLEKSLLEIVDISEKLEISPDSVKSLQELASVIAIIKKLNGEDNDSY